MVNYQRKAMSKLHPINDNIIIQFDEEKEVSEGGIHIPGNVSKSAQQEATVIAVGPGKVLKTGKRSDMGFEVGDRVIIGNRLSKIEYEDETYYIIKAENILAKI